MAMEPAVKVALGTAAFGIFWVLSGISFGDFVFGILPATLVGVVVNAAILLCLYWRELSDEKCVDVSHDALPAEVVEEDDVTSHRFSPATMSHPRRGRLPDGSVLPDAAGCEVHCSCEPVKPGSVNGDAKAAPDGVGIHQRRGSAARVTTKEEDEYCCFNSTEEKEAAMDEEWKNRLWKTCVYAITFGMLVALLLGLNMSWSAITAALALIVLDFKDARPCLEKVSYPLLLFFCGMFITVDGFNKTGIPSTFWEFMEPYARIDTPTGVVILALVILLLSNVASLLLGARVAASAAAISPAAETNAWLILAWVSTVAGNLSLLGSAANLIVCEQARRSQQFGYTLSFFSHLQFGFPATLIVTGIGLLLIKSN
ncbi:unnamed protein product [Triticum turgidum subsp. durum]|uniref:Citrate transporter-like domain-containing protein n=1 Tax=Triticum turgidum subsp. durum TaxID=4567 RepID=A0A9R1BG25_TRITD|nr:unnamed protein product [Triticum turgidum subsp. durum]